jgi:tellurite resistance protein TehA-like permease
MATIYSAFVVFMALVFAFAALFFLQYVQLLKTAPQKTNELTEEVVLSYVFTISMSILTTVINMILAAFCQKLT